MRRELLIVMCCALVLACSASFAFAEQMLVFGPKTYVKEHGKPNSYTDTFVIPKGVTNIKLVVKNGTGPADEVKNLSISINGTEVIKKSDVNATNAAEKTISYRANGANTLKATLLGPEGHSFVVALYGDKPAEPEPAPRVEEEVPVIRR